VLPFFTPTAKCQFPSSYVLVAEVTDTISPLLSRRLKLEAPLPTASPDRGLLFVVLPKKKTSCVVEEVVLNHPVIE